jgi:MarR family transcriptional regulator, 2-MHQ and catechol-resistance regulon repressor
MKLDDILKTKFISEQQKAAINLRYTYGVMNSIQIEFLNEFNLSLAQFNVLRILRGAKEDINVNTVKDRMIEKSPNTTRLLDKLVAKKLIHRYPCEKDKRVIYCGISIPGLDLLELIDIKLKKKEFVTINLNDSEAVLLNSLLDKLRSGF